MSEVLSPHSLGAKYTGEDGRQWIIEDDFFRIATILGVQKVYYRLISRNKSNTISISQENYIEISSVPKERTPDIFGSNVAHYIRNSSKVVIGVQFRKCISNGFPNKLGPEILMRNEPVKGNRCLIHIDEISSPIAQLLQKG